MKTKEEKISILKAEKQKQEEYELKQKAIKEQIKSEPKHFWKLMWFYFKKPFVWLKDNIKDWKTFLIFGIVFLVVSCEVWVPYLLGFITWGSDFSKWCFGVGSACWCFWLAPLTPFLPICICLTILIKSLFNKLRFRKLK
jgi:hypothetical protein